MGRIRIAGAVAGLLLSGLPLTAAGQGTELTPEEAVRLGLQQSARVQAAEADAEIAGAAYHEVRGTRLPAVRTQASYTRIGGDIPEATFTLPGLDTAFTILPIETNRYHSELSIEQPLYTGGRLSNQVRAAGHEADAASLLAEQERVDLAFDIRQAYWNVYAAGAMRDATGAALAEIEEHLRNVTDRFEAGAALRSEMLSVQTRRSEVLLERLEAENLVRVGRLQLTQLIGLPLDSEVTPAPGVEAEALRPALEGTPSPTVATAQAQPRIEALAERVRAQDARRAAARGELLPEVGFVGRYIYARPNPHAFTEPGEFLGTWELGVFLRWDAWDGGRRSARERQAREHMRAAEARLTHAREQAAVEVARQRLESERSAEALGVADQTVEQAEESFRVAREQFAEGVALSAQVLEAERALSAARARMARAIADYAVAQAALLHGEGRVW